MSVEYWVHPDDCGIVREDSNYDIAVPGGVVLVDAGGSRVLTLPEPLTDDQMWHVLRAINQFYSKGHEHGESAKAREIRKALDVSE